MYWLLMYCGQKMILVHAHSPGLSVSLPNTAPISRSPVQIPLNLSWVSTLRPKSNMRLLAVSNKSNKTNSEKKNSQYIYIYIFFTSGFKNSITVSCTDYSCTAVRRWFLYMPTLPDYPWVSRIRHRSPALPYRSPYLPDKIIFWAFMCLGLKFSPFLDQNVNLFAVRFLGHVFSHWQRLFLVWKRWLRF